MRTTLLITLLQALFFVFPMQGMAQKGSQTNSEISKQWRKQNIKVKGGGEKPNVITLMKAFNDKYHTWPVAEVIYRAKTLTDGQQYESTDDYRVLVDRRNGYADLATQTDMDEVQACVWRRTNGHRLFAVNLMQEHDPVANLVCWYDYDPKTETMYPETNEIDKWLEQRNPTQRGVDLPTYGKQVMVYEPFLGKPTITHIYEWDGQTHHYGSAKIEDFSFYSYGETKGAARQASEQGWTHYAIVDLKGDGDITMWFSDNAGRNSYTVFDDFKGEMNIIGAYCATNPPGTEDISFRSIITGSDKARQTVVVTRDQVGGYYYSILDSEREPYCILDLPNYATGNGEKTRQYYGYGTDDEDDRVLYKASEEIKPTVLWKKFTFTEEMP